MASTSIALASLVLWLYFGHGLGARFVEAETQSNSNSFRGKLTHVQNHTGKSDCADYADVDEYKPSTDDTCYIRVYRCDPSVQKSKLKDRNAGDASWAASDVGLSCGHYGKLLNVWRIEIPKATLQGSKRGYKQCNRNRCGGSSRVGWRYKGGGNGKKQFSFPKAAEGPGKGWKQKCLERSINIEKCLKRYTWGTNTHSEAVSIFKDKVLTSNPAPGCEPVGKVDMC